MSGTGLGARDRAVNKQTKSLFFTDMHSTEGKQTNRYRTSGCDAL